jgi:hypothetical protein
MKCSSKLHQWMFRGGCKLSTYKILTTGWLIVNKQFCRPLHAHIIFVPRFETTTLISLDYHFMSQPAVCQNDACGLHSGFGRFLFSPPSGHQVPVKYVFLFSIKHPHKTHVAFAKPAQREINNDLCNCFTRKWKQKNYLSQTYECLYHYNLVTYLNCK